MKDDDLWQEFEEQLRAKRLVADGCVPVATIFLPVRYDDDGNALVNVNGTVPMMWPPSISIEQRKALTMRIAESYRDETASLEHDDRKDT